MQHNKVLILDFGSQYTQLIARRVRELNIYCEIHPYNKIPETVSEYNAVILSGSPFSVRGEDAPHPDLSKIRGKKPMLAVCYGAQYLAHFSGGEVAPSNTREYGRANLSFIKNEEAFLNGIKKGSSYQKTRIVDIAPTISSLLGISFPNGNTGNPIDLVLKN